MTIKGFLEKRLNEYGFIQLSKMVELGINQSTVHTFIHRERRKNVKITTQKKRGELIWYLDDFKIG